MIVFIQYLAIIIIVFLGLLAGTFLSHIAKEELRPGKKYFVFIRNLLAAITGALLFTKFHLIIPLVVGIVLLIVLVNLKTTDAWLYLPASIILPIAAQNTDLLIIASSLIFLLGMVMAGLSFNVKESLKKNIKTQLAKNYYFVIIAIVLFFLLY
ncbi:MAG: hypothetical protein QF915_03335 [Candidatus Woesearchaeota archaeon]|jgi:hypothetical protein|nr:hypothetical protein [Candidatus Woesearchaeota archaeon]